MQDWQLYATIGEGSTFSKTENGHERNLTVHISPARTLNRENIEINSAEDFQKILDDNPRITWVMFYIGSYPRRGTEVGKSEKWIKTLFRDKKRIDEQRRRQSGQGA